jgi:hypothetical protein
MYSRDVSITGAAGVCYKDLLPNPASSLADTLSMSCNGLRMLSRLASQMQPFMTCAVACSSKSNSMVVRHRDTKSLFVWCLAHRASGCVNEVLPLNVMSSRQCRRLRHSTSHDASAHKFTAGGVTHQE